jgi:hypothetical protein
VDQLRCYTKEEMDMVILILEGASEGGQITKSVIKNCVVMKLESLKAITLSISILFLDIIGWFQCLMSYILVSLCGSKEPSNP